MPNCCTDWTLQLNRGMPSNTATILTKEILKRMPPPYAEVERLASHSAKVAFLSLLDRQYRMKLGGHTDPGDTIADLYP